MKIIIIFIFIFIFGIVPFCYADRVCLKKTTGKLIEYQSGDAPLGTLTKNAESAGYNKEDIEEKYITEKEWKQIKEEWIDKPVKEEAKKKEKERKKKEEEIKVKLGLSQSDFDDLKEVVK